MKLRILALFSLISVAGAGVASQRSIDPREIFALANVNPESLKTMSALHALRPELTQATYEAHVKTFAQGKQKLSEVKPILAQALRREYALAKNGYTVLYHATSGPVHALQLFYKLLYGAIKGSPVRDDFEFLRFWADDSLPHVLPEKFVHQEQRNFNESQDDVLAANLSLFGNSSKCCCRTLSLFFEGDPDPLSGDVLSGYPYLSEYAKHEIERSDAPEFLDVGLALEEELPELQADALPVNDDSDDDEDDDVNVGKLASLALLQVGVDKSQPFDDILAALDDILSLIRTSNNLLQIALPHWSVSRLCYATGHWCDAPLSLELRAQGGAAQKPFADKRGMTSRIIKSSKLNRLCKGQPSVKIPSWNLREIANVMRSWHEFFSPKTLDTAQARLIINPYIVCRPDSDIRVVRYHFMPPDMVAQLHQKTTVLANKIAQAFANTLPAEA